MVVAHCVNPFPALDQLVVYTFECVHKMNGFIGSRWMISVNDVKS